MYNLGIFFLLMGNTVSFGHGNLPVFIIGILCSATTGRLENIRRFGFADITLARAGASLFFPVHHSRLELCRVRPDVYLKIAGIPVVVQVAVVILQ